jgi:hypothetical protein
VAPSVRKEGNSDPASSSTRHRSPIAIASCYRIRGAGEPEGVSRVTFARESHRHAEDFIGGTTHRPRPAGSTS